jgi:hypothetical protein
MHHNLMKIWDHHLVNKTEKYLILEAVNQIIFYIFIVTPGPGNYRVPSDFGHYISKHAKPYNNLIRCRRKSAY